MEILLSKEQLIKLLKLLVDYQHGGEICLNCMQVVEDFKCHMHHLTLVEDCEMSDISGVLKIFSYLFSEDKSINDIING